MAEILYENPLSCAADLEGFRAEGSLRMSFDEGCLRLDSVRSPEDGQAANYVLWCPVEFPDQIRISWKFRPLSQPGLAMIWFSATARSGGSIFDPSLNTREGLYPQYHHGDINAYHLSYFRRKEPDERIFHTCNLRKSYGAHLVAQGADPIPEASEATQFYDLAIVKNGPDIAFSINGLPVLSFHDDESTGPYLRGGRIGLRQLSPMSGLYKDLTVTSL